jgi:hypothetical protein
VRKAEILFAETTASARLGWLEIGTVALERWHYQASFESGSDTCRSPCLTSLFACCRVSGGGGCRREAEQTRPVDARGVADRCVFERRRRTGKKREGK